MEYIEVNFKIEPFTTEMTELLTAFLGTTDYESFVETETGVKAYINADKFEEKDLINLLGNEPFEKVKIKFTAQKIADQNWNAVWEAGFKSLVINDKCIIRAPFHKEEKKYKYDIIIEPKMSFGTGHHETTTLMINEILNINFGGKKVLDMGSGTGILAILASMRGAKELIAIDNDEWAFMNSVENIKKNNIENIEIYKGDVTEIGDNKFDIILANINRNILLQDIGEYSKVLNPGGSLILSGIYLDDMKVIMLKCITSGLRFDSVKEKNNWVAAKFIKN